MRNIQNGSVKQRTMKNARPKAKNPIRRKAVNPQVLRTYVTPEKMRMSDLLGLLHKDYRAGDVVEIWYKDVRYTWQKSGANSWKKLSGTPKQRIRPNGKKKALSVPEKHQLRVSKRTLKSSDVGVLVIGGQTKAEARAFLKHVGYSDAEIKKLENGVVSKRAAKQNPTTFNADKINELSKTFQGHLNGEQVKTYGSSFTPNLVARAGKLSYMKIKNGRDTYELKFEGNDAWLGFDARKNLHIAGKDTRIKNVKNLPPKNRLHLLGDLEQINYITAKSHIENGDLVEYYHKLGEVDGIKPNVWVDSDGYLVVNSGNYDVGKWGIEN